MSDSNIWLFFTGKAICNSVFYIVYRCYFPILVFVSMTHFIIGYYSLWKLGKDPLRGPGFAQTIPLLFKKIVFFVLLFLTLLVANVYLTFDKMYIAFVCRSIPTVLFVIIIFVLWLLLIMRHPPETFGLDASSDRVISGDSVPSVVTKMLNWLMSRVTPLEMVPAIILLIPFVFVMAIGIGLRYSGCDSSSLLPYVTALSEYANQGDDQGIRSNKYTQKIVARDRDVRQEICNGPIYALSIEAVATGGFTKMLPFVDTNICNKIIEKHGVGYLAKSHALSIIWDCGKESLSPENKRKAYRMLKSLGDLSESTNGIEQQ